MYRMGKKSVNDKTSRQQDCIAERAKYWLWVLGVLVVGMVVYAIIASCGQVTDYSSVAQSVRQGGSLQTIAARPCPYCNGVLDVPGRCNMRGCVIYSPNWGKNTASRPCLYCVGGILDVQGRCNVLGCSNYSPNWGSQNLQARNAAATKCSKCAGGILDAQGRCNQKGCPLYSPDWGRPSSAEGIPVKKVLIRELASEVAATQGKSSVIIQSIYIGGNAEKAGLKAGDRIIRFNGRNIKSVKHFQSVVARAAPESTVKIKVIRNGEKVKSTVFVGEGEMEGATPPPKNAP